MEQAQPLLAQAQPYLDQGFQFLREGFYSVNAVLGLLIALVAAFIMSSWGRLWPIVLGAVVVDVLARALIPVVAGQGSFRLPPVVEVSFWRHVLVLLIGYVLVISLFFFMRKKLLKGGH